MLKPILHPANQDRTGARDCFCCPALLPLLLLLRFPSLAARDGERERQHREAGEGEQVIRLQLNAVWRKRERGPAALLSIAFLPQTVVCVCLMSGWLCLCGGFYSLHPVCEL